MRRPCGARRGVQVPDAAHRRLPLAHPPDGVVQRRMPSVRSETCAHGLPKQFGEYSQAYSTTAGLSVHGVVSECTMALNGYSDIRRQTSTKAQPSPSLDLNALWGPQRSRSLTALPTAVQLWSKSIATANAVVSAVRVAMHVVQMLAAHATYNDMQHAACSIRHAACAAHVVQMLAAGNQDGELLVLGKCAHDEHIHADAVQDTRTHTPRHPLRCKSLTSHAVDYGARNRTDRFSRVWPAVNSLFAVPPPSQ